MESSTAFLYLEFQSGTDNDRAGKGRAIDVSRITQLTLVKILLIGIEDVLHARVDAEAANAGYIELIAQLAAHVPERRSPEISV